MSFPRGPDLDPKPVDRTKRPADISDQYEISRSANGKPSSRHVAGKTKPGQPAVHFFLQEHVLPAIPQEAFPRGSS